MIILFSDLHLADTVERSTLNVGRFTECLTRLIREAGDRGLKKVTVVLLGDIFELLKSTKWLENNKRPWERVSDAHISTVESIFKSVLSSNGEFFEALRGLARDYPFVELRYVPGNHDYLMHTEMGRKAKSLLKDSLPIGNGGEELDDYFFDPSHKLVARHGHEWDPENRYKNGQAAIGDAIVIDLLLRLPILVAEKMKMDINDPALNFLHDLDNVLPQTPAMMAKWIILGLDCIKDREVAGRAIQEAFNEIAVSLKATTEETEFESIETANWWIDFLRRTITSLVPHFDILTTALRIPPGGNGPGPYKDFAKQDFAVTNRAGMAHRFVVCGHTHVPELAILHNERPGTPAPVYLNTGTWRRVQYASVTKGGRRALPRFETLEVESFVVIYNGEEQSLGLPAYELHRIIRGV